MAKTEDPKLICGLTEREAICKAVSESPELSGNKKAAALCAVLQKEKNGTVYSILKQILCRDEESALVIRFLIRAFSIWLPMNLYAQFPVLFPYAVRNPKCRKQKTHRPELWGFPNPDGYMLDDNTLLKNFAKGKPVKSGNTLPWYANANGIGSGYMAAHIWRCPTGFVKGAKNENGLLASRRPYLNSFVANIAWLPTGIAKLTDDEESLAQRYYQSLSRKVYFDAEVDMALKNLVMKLWEELPKSSEDIDAVNIEDLATLSVTDKDIAKLCDQLGAIVHNLQNAITESNVPPPYAHKRYNVKNLRQRDVANLKRTCRYLVTYSRCVDGKDAVVDLSNLASVFDDSIECPSTIYCITPKGKYTVQDENYKEILHQMHTKKSFKEQPMISNKKNMKDNIGEKVRKLGADIVMSVMVNDVGDSGITQAKLFRRCGFSWGGNGGPTESQQQFWIAALMQKLKADGLVCRTKEHGPWKSTALGLAKYAGTPNIAKNDARIVQFRDMAEKCVLSVVEGALDCAPTAKGLPQRLISVRTSLCWDDYPYATFNQQTYWVIGLLNYLAQNHILKRGEKKTCWRLY